MLYLYIWWWWRKKIPLTCSLQYSSSGLGNFSLCLYTPDPSKSVSLWLHWARKHQAQLYCTEEESLTLSGVGGAPIPQLCAVWDLLRASDEEVADFNILPTSTPCSCHISLPAWWQNCWYTRQGFSSEAGAMRKQKVKSYMLHGTKRNVTFHCILFYFPCILK